MNTARERGQWAEYLVARTLERQGFTILETNYRKPYGEIDIIALKSDLLVFVEVKMRIASTVPLEAIITRRKRNRISAVARAYLAATGYETTKSCRFDVALLDGTTGSLTYIPQAFSESEHEQ